MAQVPQQLIDPIHAYGKAYSSWSEPNEVVSIMSVPRQQHRELQGFVKALFDRYDAPVLDFADILCDDTVCPLGTSDTSYYFDNDHLSLEWGRIDFYQRS